MHGTIPPLPHTSTWRARIILPFYYHIELQDLTLDGAISVTAIEVITVV